MLAIEAGTGTGKTFAYLVPALLSGRQVIISTGTRTLQDQLFNRDLPTVAKALGRPARVALLKGRANYLCLHRLELAESMPQLPGIPVPNARMLARIRRWSRETATGDLAEVTSLRDTDPVRARRDLDARELPRQRVSCLRALPRGRRAARGAGGRHRGREPSPAARGPRDEGRGLRRAAAGRRGRDPRRSAPGAGDRRAVLRPRVLRAPGRAAGARRARRTRAARARGHRAARAPRHARIGDRRGGAPRSPAAATASTGRRCPDAFVAALERVREALARLAVQNWPAPMPTTRACAGRASRGRSCRKSLEDDRRCRRGRRPALGRAVPRRLHAGVHAVRSRDPPRAS